MMAWFQDEIKKGLECVVANAGVEIVYTQGAKRAELLAVSGTGNRKALPAEVPRRIGERDWLIMRDRLKSGDEFLVPKRGDKIQAGGVTYEVLPTNGKDFYDDPVDCQYRVHTKVIPG